MLALFLACALHWGLPPASQWSMGPVLVPVAEPGLDLALHDAFVIALSESDMLGSEAMPSLNVDVLSADWLPAGRSEAGVLYEAHLSLRLTAGGHSQTFSLSRLSPDPGAAAVVWVRSAIFEDLSSLAAERAVRWLSTLQQPSPSGLSGADGSP
jgi:hypothetical protein